MRRGFTLIELMVAMAILAVVSVMAVQALGGVFYQRSILTRIDDRDAALIRALSQLRQDLEAAVPAPEGDGLVAGIEVGAGRLAWWRGGLAEVPGGPSGGYGAVSWTLDAGRLTRGSLRASSDGRPVPRSAVVLLGVTGLSLVALGAGEGGDSRDLAPGYEVILDTENWGPLRLVVAR